MFGRFRSSRSTGLTICFTEMRRISSEVRKEKEIPATVDGRECEIFITEDLESETKIFLLQLLHHVTKRVQIRKSSMTSQFIALPFLLTLGFPDFIFCASPTSSAMSPLYVSLSCCRDSLVCSR